MSAILRELAVVGQGKSLGSCEPLRLDRAWCDSEMSGQLS
jgi:hypothetical protein